MAAPQLQISADYWLLLFLTQGGRLCNQSASQPDWKSGAVLASNSGTKTKYTLFRCGSMWLQTRGSGSTQTGGKKQDVTELCILFCVKVCEISSIRLPPHNTPHMPLASCFLVCRSGVLYEACRDFPDSVAVHRLLYVNDPSYVFHAGGIKASTLPSESFK
jgi:hypothetical protein